MAFRVVVSFFFAYHMAGGRTWSLILWNMAFQLQGGGGFFFFGPAAPDFMMYSTLDFRLCVCLFIYLYLLSCVYPNCEDMFVLWQSQPS